MKDQKPVNRGNNEDLKGAAVKFPPPLAFLLCLFAGAGIQFFWPIGLIDSMIVRSAGGILVLLALGTLILLALRFRREKTSIEPWKPTTRIMSSGIYAYSRNPIYLSFCLIVIGVGLSQNSFWIFISFVPAVFIVFHTAIVREEKYLEQKFGEEYREYRNRVRRWL